MILINIDIYLKPSSISVEADQKMIEQVLINLLINSIQAVEAKDSPEIKIQARQIDKSIVIDIIDNGIGIQEEIQDNIFIPFFSAKQNGSGIGLSLSKQIMKLNRGTLELISEKGYTTFRLVL